MRSLPAHCRTTYRDFADPRRKCALVPGLTTTSGRRMSDDWVCRPPCGGCGWARACQPSSTSIQRLTIGGWRKKPLPSSRATSGPGTETARTHEQRVLDVWPAHHQRTACGGRHSGVRHHQPPVSAALALVHAFRRRNLSGSPRRTCPRVRGRRIRWQISNLTPEVVDVDAKRR